MSASVRVSEVGIGVSTRKNYWEMVSLRPIVDWLRSRGFIYEGGPGGNLVYAWSCRGGYDCTALEFYPLGDAGVNAIIGHHASGSNPRLIIGQWFRNSTKELITCRIQARTEASTTTWIWNCEW